MSVEITPPGTRGANFPRPPGPVLWLMNAVQSGAFRLFGKRMQIAGLRVLKLTTRGARTGRPRSTVLGWLPDGPDAWLVIGSIGGAARHPGWYHNLAAHPDRVWIEVGGRRLRVRPESLKGAEREDAWRRLVATSPRYGAYQETTDRLIPVIRLTPAE